MNRPFIKGNNFPKNFTEDITEALKKSEHKKAISSDTPFIGPIALASCGNRGAVRIFEDTDATTCLGFNDNIYLCLEDQATLVELLLENLEHENEQ